ncbi:MAG TPA: hypothetical protein VF807_13345 [Ktedonobacterales bacterium]
MLPQVNLNGMDRVAQTSSATASPSPAAGEREAPRELTFTERQGLAMGWVGMALGMFLLLGGLALWAAVAFSAGFGGWLLATGLMGLVMIAVIIAVTYFIVRPRR